MKSHPVERKIWSAASIAVHIYLKVRVSALKGNSSAAKSIGACT
jgi:hypothetical protein